MKGMFKVVACVLGLAVVGAVAADEAPDAAFAQGDTLVCEQYGFAGDAEKFHKIKANKKQSVFKITAASVIYEGVQYDSVNPGWVGLDGMALTYHSEKNNKLLYLYVTDKGEREVGLSSIELDSDTIFQDKAVFQGCQFKQGMVDASSSQVLRTNARGTQFTLPVYVL